MFLPPYSPDYNPAEELFSYINYYLKDHDDLFQNTSTSSLKDILNSAFRSVTEELFNITLERLVLVALKTF